jgi:RNA polymerase sigma-70 factor (ECF subfamily)
MVNKTDSASGFETLLKPHLERLYRLAWRLTQSKAEAEDLFQDVLVKAFTGLQQLATIEEPGSWLSRVMYNHFVDNRRRFARQRLVTVDESRLPEKSFEAVAGGSDPARESERQQLVLQLDRALAALSDEHRVVVLLHDVEAYKLTEIQDITGDPIGTIKSRLHRARSRLRQLLEADGTFFAPEACKDSSEEETDDLPAAQ